MHRYGCILSTSARNCCIFWVRNLSRCARSRVARNLFTAKDLPEPTLQRQSQPALGSHDKAHAPRGHSSRRTNHQSPRLSSLRRRDARTDASIPVSYQYAATIRKRTCHLVLDSLDLWTAFLVHDQPVCAVVPDQVGRLPRRFQSDAGIRAAAVSSRASQPGVARFNASLRRKHDPHGLTPTAVVPAATASPRRTWRDPRVITRGIRTCCTSGSWAAILRACTAWRNRH